VWTTIRVPELIRSTPRPSVFTKVAYAVDETLELLSIGPHCAVRRRSNEATSNASSSAKKTLFYAADLAAFLARAPAPERNRMRAKSITGPSLDIIAENARLIF